MKVLIINVNSHIGSTGKISYGLLKYLQNLGHQVKLCCRGGKEESIDDEDIITLNTKVDLVISKSLCLLTGYEGIFNRKATNKVLKIIKEFKPDIVQLYNLHGYWLNHYSLLAFLKEKQINVVYSMLDEYPYLGNCTFSYGCEQWKSRCKKCPSGLRMHYLNSKMFDRSEWTFIRKQSIYNNWDNIVFTGPKWVCQQAKESSLLKDCHIFNLEEPINPKIFYPRDTKNLRRDLDIPEDAKVILTVAWASAERKGAKYFYQAAMKMRNEKNIYFVHVGYNIDSWDLPENYRAIAGVKDQDKLAEYYSLGDLFICDSLADTTPTSCMEALSCGTPIAGFDYGAIPYICPKGLGTFSKCFDVDAQVDVIKTAPIKDIQLIKRCNEYARDNYWMSTIYEKQVELYEKLLNQ